MNTNATEVLDGPSSSVTRNVGLVLGPLLGVAVYLIIGSEILSPEGRILSALASMTVLWWFLEVASPAVVALVFAVLAAIMGVETPEKVFAPFGNPIIFFFMGSFFLARAIEIHGVAKVLLEHVLHLPGVKGHPARAAACLVAGGVLLSSMMNNTAAAALLLPFCIALSRHSFKDNSKGREGAVLGVAVGVSVGGMITTFGTAPNLISLGLLKTTVGNTISFLEWFKYSLPVAIPLAAFLIWRALRITKTLNPQETYALEKDTSIKLSRSGRRSFALVILAMLLLVLTSSVARLGFIGETGAILLPSLLLFFVPCGDSKRPLLTWKEATEIDWQSLLLFGGGLSLGTLLFSTGVAKAIGDSLAPLAANPQLFFAALTFVMLLLTEIASNTASVTLFIPIVIAICESAGLPTQVFVAGVAITASLGFMLPVGTPPNALAYGTGLVSARQMTRYGFMVDLLGYLLVVGSFLAFHF